jgi:hypothetical protein
MVGATRMRVYRKTMMIAMSTAKKTISMSLAMKVDDSTHVRIKLID